MRRLWAAVLLLTAVAALCFFTIRHQQKQVDALLKSLDKVEAAYRTNDTDKIHQLAKALQEEYEQRAAFLPYFISHDDLIESQEAVTMLTAALEEDNPEEFLLEAARLRQQLLWLREVDVPHWRNIL